MTAVPPRCLALANRSGGHFVIEAMVTLMAVCSGLVLLISFFYLGFVKLWLGHWLYEGTLCSLGEPRVSLCENYVRRRGCDLLPFGEVQVLKIRKSSTQARGHMVYGFLSLPPLEIRRQIILETSHLATSSLHSPLR